jgi:ferredoxin
MPIAAQWSGGSTMEASRFEQLVKQVLGGGTRRGLLRLSAALPLTGVLIAWLDPDAEARNKKKKKKRKKKRPTCGKAGQGPVKGTCCTGSVLVDTVCQACTVCANGCPFTALQPAINAASDGDTIAICPGSVVGDLYFDKDLRLVGAGAKSTTLQGTRTTSVVYVQSSTVTLERLRITGGNLASGGGVRNGGGTVELINCIVTDNALAPGYEGGGIYNATLSTLTLRNSTVFENSSNNGGGVFNGGAMNVIASEIRANSAVYGGGIYNGVDAQLTVDAASRITGNTVSTAGGGIYNDTDSAVTLATATIVTANAPNNCAGTAVALCSS